MAYISSGLPTISFSENLPNIVIGGVATTARLAVTLNGTYIANKIELVPDANQRITIYTRQFVRNLTASNPIEKIGNFELPSIRFSISTGLQTLSLACTLIPGGTACDIDDMPGWLDKNFLTWQPQIIETTPDQPQWLFSVPAGRYTTYEFHSRLYAADGRIITKELQYVGNSNILMQNTAGFRDLWMSECIERKIEPVAYDVYGRAYSQSGWIENVPFAQRYVLREPQASDTCFGFTNTLGGFDTLIFQGRMLYKPEGDAETFVNNGIESELANDYTSFWEASTGYIDTQRMAGQIQDFLKSNSRWIYRNGAWKKIVVDEYKVEHTPHELNAYSFKYHLAERNERRIYERRELPDVELPTDFFEIPSFK